MKYRFCDQYRRLFSNDQTSNDGERDMLMLDRRTLLRAGSAAVEAATLAPIVPALAHAPLAGNNQKQADFLAAALAKAGPAQLHDLHMVQSVMALPLSTSTRHIRTSCRISA
jgi:malonate decarboxylase alpha subunit